MTEQKDTDEIIDVTPGDTPEAEEPEAEEASERQVGDVSPAYTWEPKAADVEDGVGKAGKAGKKEPAYAKYAAAAACAVFLAAGCFAIGRATMPQAAEAPQEPSPAAVEQPAAEEEAAETETKAEDSHEHSWGPVYITVHHDRQAHTETVAATYKDEYVPETVCNTCEQVVTGATERHTGLTGHKSFSVNVPVLESVLDVGEHEVEVVDSEAYDSESLDGYECTGCGERMTVDQAKSAGVYKASDEK